MGGSTGGSIGGSTGGSTGGSSGGSTGGSTGGKEPSVLRRRFQYFWSSLKRALVFGPCALLAVVKSDDAERMAEAKTKELNLMVADGKLLETASCEVRSLFCEHNWMMGWGSQLASSLATIANTCETVS